MEPDSGAGSRAIDGSSERGVASTRRRLDGGNSVDPLLAGGDGRPKDLFSGSSCSLSSSAASEWDLSPVSLNHTNLIRRQDRPSVAKIVGAAHVCRVVAA